jgi:hypothetical protein
MLRKDAFFAVGGYRRLLAPAEDLDLWLRIAERHGLANLGAVVVRYRVHPEQATVRSCEAQALGSLAARIAARARAEGVPIRSTRSTGLTAGCFSGSGRPRRRLRRPSSTR